MIIRTENRIAARYFLVTFLVSWAGILGVSFFLGMPTTGVPVLVYYAGIAVFLWSIVGYLFCKGQLK